MTYFLLLTLLATGNFEERELAQHYLTILPGKFELYRTIISKSKDPEEVLRLKEIAWLKWCEETDEKYRTEYYYEENRKLNDKLQKEGFEDELRICNAR